MIFWEKTLWEGESLHNGKIKVVESRGIRRLVADRYTHSRTLDDFGRTNHYWDRFRENLPPLSKNPRILILGLAGGTIAKILTNKYKNLFIRGVEIDPTIVALGKKYFYLNELNIDIHVEDAGKYINKDSEKYDAICVDLFFREKASDLLQNEEFLKKVRERMKSDGIVIINRICKSKEEDDDYIRNLKRVFNVLTVARERGNDYEQNVIFYGKP